MKKLKKVFKAGIILTVTMAFVACSETAKDIGAESEEHEHSEHEHNDMETTDTHDDGHSHEHGEEAEDGHHDEMSSEASGEGMLWNPSGDAGELLNSDFHFIAGNAENLESVTKESANGESILSLTANGDPTAFVFHKQYGNVGIIATIDRQDFNGTLKLLHHAKDAMNYEFVSINGSIMKLGRVVDGTEKVFDEGQFTPTEGWLELKLTAAGTHFKGYANNKMITHGHGNKMDDGFVGLMFEGNGTVDLKSIEVALLEDE